MTCSESGMTAGATIFAAGVSATQGAVVSISKKTAPFSLTARKTSESVSLLTGCSPWTSEQAIRTIGQASPEIWTFDQDTRMREYSSLKIRLQ